MTEHAERPEMHKKTIYIPDNLHEKMKQSDISMDCSFNWSKIACKAFMDCLNRKKEIDKKMVTEKVIAVIGNVEIIMRETK